MDSTADTPGSELEEALIAIWIRALGVEPIGVHDDFFELGGHSLLAIEMVAEISSLVGIDVLVSDLVAAPTVAGLAEAISRTILEKADPETLAQLAAESALQNRKAP